MISNEQLRQFVAENGDILDTKVAAEQGIPRRVLAKLCANGVLQRIGKGQYVFADDMYDELFSLCSRSKNIIFSHETALFLHGISDRTPFEHAITVPSNGVPSKAVMEICKVYYIKPELFDMGRTTLTTPSGNQVAAYDLERTICDIVRSRSRVGIETFIAALKAYAANPQKNLNRLYDYAKELRVAKLIRKYLEVLL